MGCVIGGLPQLLEARRPGHDRYGEIAERCLAGLAVAPAVWRESVLDGERFGYADAARIRAAAQQGFVRRAELDVHEARRAGEIAASWRVGQGESETLALGLEHGRALVDDGWAARVAEIEEFIRRHT